MFNIVDFGMQFDVWDWWLNGDMKKESHVRDDESEVRLMMKCWGWRAPLLVRLPLLYIRLRIRLCVVYGCILIIYAYILCVCVYILLYTMCNVCLFYHAYIFMVLIINKISTKLLQASPDGTCSSLLTPLKITFLSPHPN